MSAPVLSIQNLQMRFGGLIAIADVSFDVARNAVTALIGPNGAGKTTVFNCITGFYRAHGGSITLQRADGEQLALQRMPRHLISRDAGVVRTFQNVRLFGGMTALENLLVAQHKVLMPASGFSLWGLLKLPVYERAKHGAIEKAMGWLERVGLADRADDPAGALPYGDQRRLEIARAMCADPVVLCLDEPAAGLNPRESFELGELLRSLADAGTTVLLIEHDMAVVMEISDQVVVLDRGMKIASGTPDAVRNDSTVIAAYLGEPEVAA